MADGNRDSRRRFGRRGRPRPAEQSAERSVEETKPRLPDAPPVMCPVCGKQIFDLSSAIAGRGSGEPVHFDCALAQAAEGEHLEAGEKVAYIGRGAFAVIEFRDKSNTTFTIKRKIQWEKEGEKFDWRRGIQQRMGL